MGNAKTLVRLLVGSIVLAGVCGGAAFADDAAGLRMPKIFTGNMVLQQEMPIAVWGWAKPGEFVTVSFNGKTAKATAGADGKWLTKLDAMKADGKSHVLTVTADSGKVELKNVVLGEVWICAGQSNMNREAPIDVNDPDMRLFWVHANPIIPMKDEFARNSMGWLPADPKKVSSPEMVKYREQTFDRGWKQGFAEVGYVFGKRVRKELGVPVGLIKAAYGGSVAKQWTPVPGIEKDHPFGQECKNGDGVLWQSMMAGMVPMTVRGVVWYQGETDGRNWNYDKDLTAMIEAWRKQFRQPNMPFYMAQIAQTTYASGMLRVWECQTRVAATVPNVYLASSNDLWDGGRTKPDAIHPDKGIGHEAPTGWPAAGSSNPHPPHKDIVANRLAEEALVYTYGKDLGHEVLPPTYASHAVKDGKVLVTFDHVGDGLKTDDGEAPNWFEVAPAAANENDIQYVKAQAKIVGKDTVEVWSPAVKDPKYVRFAWEMYARHNLYNSSGIPAITFRTDTRNTKKR